MKYEDIIAEAEKDLEQESIERVKQEIKDLLLEIKLCEQTLEKLKSNLEEKKKESIYK